MKLFRSICWFLLKSNLFISVCAVAVCLETSVILHRPFHNVAFYSAVFFATLFAYNIYYFKSKTFSYYRFFAFSGFIGLLPSLYFMKGVSWFYFGVSFFLYVIYLFPVFRSFKKPEFYTVQKLAILILVWVIVSFLLPAGPIVWDQISVAMLLYRILLMTCLCTLFFIRDEKDPGFRKVAIHACFPLGILQMVLAIFLTIYGDTGLGCIYVFITLLTLLAGIYFNTLTRSEDSYLFYVDGIMLLQSIFVLIKFFMFHES